MANKIENQLAVSSATSLDPYKELQTKKMKNILAKSADHIMERLDDLPDDLKLEARTICAYIRDEVTFKALIHWRLREILQFMGIRTLNELLSLSSEDLFFTLSKHHLNYRRLLKDLDEKQIKHDFEAKPWKNKK